VVSEVLDNDLKELELVDGILMRTMTMTVEQNLSG